MFSIKFINIKCGGDGKIDGGSSGHGSLFENNKEYIDFLHNFIDEKQINSISDIGCGDWETMSNVNLDGIKYTGYDVVQRIIEINTENYSTDSIKFIHTSINYDYNDADLLICKDVMQHLTFYNIESILKQLHKYKYSFLINDSTNEENIEIDEQALQYLSNHFQLSDGDRDGGFRRIDLLKPPFLKYIEEEFSIEIFKLWKAPLLNKELILLKRIYQGT